MALKVPFSTKDEKAALWHSTAHVLADAVKRLFPDVKLGIGPSIDEGFYYDFDKREPFTPEDLEKIEQQMKKIIESNVKFEDVSMSRPDAKKFLAKEPLKLELLEEIKDKEISFHKHGKFTDLCAKPVIQSTGQIGAVKLLNVAAAYWRGDQKRQSLQRIYGISFPNKKELDEWLSVKEEAEKRDHRKLGPQLDLFSLHEIAPAMPFFHPKGTVIYNGLIDFRRELDKKYGFVEIRTPNLASVELYKTSGHWSHYKELMFPVKTKDEDLAFRAMGCPFAQIVYKTRSRSYKELPLRLAEFDTLGRNEYGGAWHGLMRVRQLMQDDAHVFVSEDQIESEVTQLLKLTDDVYKVFGLSYRALLSTRDPKNFMGDVHLWNKAEDIMRHILKKSKVEWAEAPKEGAFYGPKIDIMVKDSLGREWQLATIQLDFQQPIRFNLKYTGADNASHTPIIIHRVILGSLERFMGILIEHYAGAFPVWLAPVQVKLLNFTDRNMDYTKKVQKKLEYVGLRVETDYENNTVEYKVRAAELEKVPYVLVVGDKEEKADTVAVRKRGEGKVKFGVKVDDFIKQIKQEIEDKV
jgi:threonyl-tRNA synthetase